MTNYEFHASAITPTVMRAIPAYCISDIRSPKRKYDATMARTKLRLVIG